MRLLAWVNGRVVDASEYQPQYPYVQQRIHTLGFQASNIEEHIRLLCAASQRYFAFASLCKASDAQCIIAKLLDLSRVTKSSSVPVVMRLDCRGELSFVVEHPTFGKGGYLRAKRLAGVTLNFPIHNVDVQDSMSVSADMLADTLVAPLGGERAILVDANDNLISRSWQPIFVAFNNRVYTPKAHDSVEYQVACRAFERAGLKLEVRQIANSVLERMEEIFVVDIMGISSYAKIRKHRLLSALALRVARVMEPMSED